MESIRDHEDFASVVSFSVVSGEFATSSGGDLAPIADYALGQQGFSRSERFGDQSRDRSCF